MSEIRCITESDDRKEISRIFEKGFGSKLIATVLDGLKEQSYDDEPVGCVSYTKLGMGEYEVACLCIVPEFQGKGIGTHAIRFLKTLLEDWKKLTLVTPIDKKENVKFYTEKCGFRIESTERDGNVELARFVSEK